ncbi:MAG: hypothetical protein FK733_19160 [Asgard group archaeon]|nr:hypothetical protein [Asgard group archaeon]
MKRSNYYIFMVISALILPSLILPAISYTPTQGYAEDVKIGFSWINGIIGATEMIDAGYVKAVDMGCQIEHREYRWDYLNYSLSNSLWEWDQIYLDRYPGIDRSLDISVVSGNSSAMPFQHDYKPYLVLPTNNTRFNDTAVINSLRNTTVLAMDILELDYISFSTETNGFFEGYYNETSKGFDTAMFADFIDLLEQMYDFIKVNYTDTKVCTNFRYQPPSDLVLIEAMINQMNDTCDIFSVSPRIFTDDYGFLAQPNELEVLERFSSFANLTDKKIAITNTYTISDSRAGSSEYYQAQYVRSLFNFIELYDHQIEFVCWYTIFDYPPGYLTTYFSPLLEVHATAGLFTPSGSHKMAYYAWIEEMRAAGKLPEYWKAWKIALGSLVFAAVLGFLAYAYVVEGLPQLKEKLKKEAEEQQDEKPDKLSFEKQKKKPQKRTKKPKTIEFTNEKIDDNQNDISTDDIEENND